MAVEKLLQTVKCSAQHMQANCLSVSQAHLDSGGVGCEKTLSEAQKSFEPSLPLNIHDTSCPTQGLVGGVGGSCCSGAGPSSHSEPG